MTPLVRAIQRQIPRATGQIWAGLCCWPRSVSILAHRIFLKENLLSFEFKSDTCNLCIKLNTHLIGLIPISMSSLWLYLSISTACIIFRYLYTICGISCVDLTLFCKKLKIWSFEDWNWVFPLFSDAMISYLSCITCFGILGAVDLH
jgi:hypothetical protein